MYICLHGQPFEGDVSRGGRPCRLEQGTVLAVDAERVTDGLRRTVTYEATFVPSYCLIALLLLSCSCRVE